MDFFDMAGPKADNADHANDADDADKGRSGEPTRRAEASRQAASAVPLAERMRPRDFGEWLGQPEAAGPASPLRRMLEAGALPSLVLWGPPGSGKTTLARLIAGATDMAFHSLSAVTSGIKEVKAIIDQARQRLAIKGRRTLLFIDEIHRFNKAQQDAFLPHVENGTITLIGATTENPSFSVIPALLSRCRVVALTPLAEADLAVLVRRALADAERGLGAERWEVEDGLLDRIAQLADGDARQALAALEQCAAVARAGEIQFIRDDRNDEDAIDAPATPARRLTLAMLSEVLQRQALLYDKTGEEHFNLISAFHKSMRASDPQGAVYWLFRMLESGEDPLWIARRIVAAASEDVGLADPQAMVVAVSALHSFQSLGLPEGELPLAEAAIYVATAPKSNAVNEARMGAKAAAKQHGALGVPLHLRNAPTGLMKSLGYGREYQYDHACPDHFSGQPTLPEKLEGTTFYEPGAFGFEKEIKKRMDWWEQRRRERRDAAGNLP
jgi:putative ATPase